MAQIHELIPKIMVEMGAIGKNRRNPQQGYAFRGIDDMYNALQGPMSKFGVFCVPKVLKRDSTEFENQKGTRMNRVMLDIQFNFYAPDGSSIECVTVGEALDTSDKAANKAMSAAQKYAFLQVFCIPTEEPKDTENDHIEPDARPHYEEPSVQIDRVPARSEPDPGDWYDKLGMACQAKGYGIGELEAVIASGRNKFKQPDENKFTDDQWGQLIDAVCQGKFDVKFKKTPRKETVNA